MEFAEGFGSVGIKKGDHTTGRRAGVCTILEGKAGSPGACCDCDA